MAGNMRAQEMSTRGRGIEKIQETPPLLAPQASLIEAGVLLAAELSLPVLLRRLVEIAVRISRARYGALGVSGPGGGIVEFITVGLDNDQRAAIGPIPTGRGILGTLIHDPRPLRLDRLQDGRHDEQEQGHPGRQQERPVGERAERERRLPFVLRLNREDEDEQREAAQPHRPRDRQRPGQNA